VSSTIPDPASTDWVPLFDLGRQPVKYLGQYNAGTTYNDGDVVVGPDGLTYICVADNTLGVTPSWAGVYPPWPPAYGTTLPASPVNGQEAILVDSVTAPTYQWRFRYNASSSSIYKWEYVGGTDYFAVLGAQESRPGSIGAGDLTTVGPSLTIPRNGIYAVQWGALINNAGQNQYGGAVLTTAAGGRLGGMEADISAPTWSAVSVMDSVTITSGGIKLQYFNNNSGAVTFGNRWISARPVRIS
jgi:hypothetical protein